MGIIKKSNGAYVNPIVISYQEGQTCETVLIFPVQRY